MESARHAAERVARDSYGRLLALLAARTRDLAGAEDALADALTAALRIWPERGVPDNPEAWLMTAARRTLGHGARHHAVRNAAAEALLLAADERASYTIGTFPDERLKLLFVCAHPAIDAGMHTPLMLQVVLGLDAARIAAAFLTAPAAMAQRLVRAKVKIRDAGIRFAEPEAHDLAPRRAAVLSAIYAAYGTGWDEAFGGEASEGLTEEAIYLARLIVALMPGEPEPLGLLALLLHCEARRPARRDARGNYVPLAEQDARRWASAMIVEAEAALTDAAQLRRPGRFQTEAAIQSLHAQGAITGRAAPDALALLYDVLVTQAPSIGAGVARAAAHAAAGGPVAGLALLDDLPQDRITAYQPYWATRAALLLQMESGEASAAFDKAIGLASDEAVRAFLRRKRDCA
jgi:RNA polymerase sigma-70 factor (ECF subfamily)